MDRRPACGTGRPTLVRRPLRGFPAMLGQADQGSQSAPPGRPKAAEPPPRGVAKHTKWQAGGRYVERSEFSETPPGASSAGQSPQATRDI